MKKKRPVSDHFDGEIFFNPTLKDTSGKSFFSALKMWLSTKRDEWPKWVENTGRSQTNLSLQKNEVAITFVNHASFLIQIAGLNILTDPVWSHRVSPFTWLGPSRVRPPGIALEDLPPIDLILVSHNHYDHLDIATLRRLNSKFAPQIYVAAGDLQLVESLGFQKALEFDWWQSCQFNENVKVIYTPTQHFSARTLSDRNHSLWGGFVVEAAGQRIYFGGDAGYSTHYTSIYEKIGAPTLSLLGIGAYEPNWFMKSMHMNPAEAVQAHQDLHSHLSIGMHFGTFQLSAEGFDQPTRDLKMALEQAGISQDKFITLLEGETRVFERV